MEAADLYDLLSRLINYAIGIPFLILGMIGSIMIVVVFTRQRSFWRNPSITYLIAGAVITGIHLPTVYIQMILVYGFHTSLMNTNVAACQEHTYLRYVTNVSAISFPCWAAFDQYACTSRNASFRQRWSSLRIARIISILNTLFWILIYIPIIFNTTIRNGVCSFVPGPYTSFNTYAFTPFVYCIGPMLVITLSARGTIKNLHSSNLAQNSHQRLARQIRTMLIPQLVILIISGIPFGFQGIYLDITSSVPKDVTRIQLENFIGQVILIFYHFNYVFSFYIYIFMSSEVRKALKKTIFKLLRITRVVPFAATTENSVSLRQLNNVDSSCKA